MLNRLRLLTVACCLLAAFGSIAAYADAQGNARDEAFKKEIAAMAGTWKPILMEFEGTKAPDEMLKEISVTRGESGKVVTRRKDVVLVEGTVKKIDATAKPKAIDTEEVLGEQKGKIIQGIYELHGDTLRVCVTLPGKGERPTEFSAKAGSGWKLIVYQRERQ